MKQQRLRFKLVALFLFALFAALSVWGGYSVLSYGNRWFASKYNTRVHAQRNNVIAGDILDRNQVILATTADGQRIYQRDNAARTAIVHLLGDREGNIANGVETFQTSYLYGFQTELPDLVKGLFSDATRHGDNVILTIDSRLCTAIPTWFASIPGASGKNGAAVVMNYRTGELLAMISLPGYDPDHITEQLRSDPNQPFWNRATQGKYPPGSTFKVITSAAALQALPGISERTDLTCTGALPVDGLTVTDWAGSVHGALSLRQALTVSCNNVFASLALQMGDGALRHAAENFGFNDNFLFRDLVVENSSYPITNRTQWAIAQSGVGQSAITATPLHMCMVAASVANDGVMMEPRLVMGVAGSSGRVRSLAEPKVYRTVIPHDTAAYLKSCMLDVTNLGTGTRAAVNGMTICGKTGSAESSLNGQPVTYGWYIGFIDDPDMPYAVSVLV